MTTATLLTPPLGDVESITQGLAAALASERFRAVIAGVDIARNTGATTPWQGAIGSIYAYERANLEVYPAAEVIAAQATYDTDADEAAAVHRISIDWTQVGDDEQTVTRDIQRLVLATRIFFRHSVLDGSFGIGPMLVEFEDYTHLSPGTGAHAFLKGGLLILAVKSWSN